MNNKEQKGLYITAAIIFSSMLLITNSTNTYADSTIAPNKTTKSEMTQPAAEKSDEFSDNMDINIDDATLNKDPFERFNRVMFGFNDALDTFIIKPVAKLYNAIMPKPLNQGVHNFFNNLGELPTIGNDLLQLNLYQMTRDISRFAINTTFGIGGLFDIATRVQLPYFQNDFGLTLARWGYKDSNYLVLPFLGSNTIRDGLGIPVDYFEFSVYPYVQPQARRYQLLGLLLVDHRANLLQFESVLEEAAIDKYVFMRNAYMQHRAYQIEQVKHLGYRDQMRNFAEISDA